MQNKISGTLVVSSLICLFLLSLFLYLAFGCPDKKYPYMFQKYILKIDEWTLALKVPKTGLYQRWHKNGKLAEKTQVSDGKINGKSIEYDENGLPVFIGRFDNNNKEGYHLWYKGGALYTKKKYRGNIVIEINLLNGKKLNKEDEKTAIEDELNGILSP